MKNRNRQRFGALVAKTMRQKNMNARQLAELAGLTESAVWRIVRGNRHPSLTTALLLARALEIETGAL